MNIECGFVLNCMNFCDVYNCFVVWLILFMYSISWLYFYVFVVCVVVLLSSVCVMCCL